MEPIDPARVAEYLSEHPEFFAAHPALLSALTVPHPQNGQAISLVERQSLLLRDRIRALELQQAQILRNGQDNDAIADRLVRWVRALLMAEDPAQLPQVAVAELQRVFEVPLAAVRVWPARTVYVDESWAQPVGDDVRQLADSMAVPYCGPNAGFEAARWLAAAAGGAPAQSVALLPLRTGAETRSFGLIVLGSPDPQRFQESMGTDFLARLAELASAALARLRAR